MQESLLERVVVEHGMVRHLLEAVAVAQLVVLLMVVAEHKVLLAQKVEMVPMMLGH